MTNLEILNVLQKKDLLAGLKGNYRFTKAMTLNLKKIKEEVDMIKSYVKPTPEMIEFENKKEKLLKDYSNNKFKEVNGVKHFDIPEENQEEYTKEVNELLEEYSEHIEEFKKQNLRQLEALKSECTIDFHMIQEKDMPDEITVEQMELLINFIKM